MQIWFVGCFPCSDHNERTLMMRSLHLQSTVCSKSHLRPRCTSKRVKHAITCNSTLNAFSDQQTCYRQLVEFIQREGGYVHPALQVSTSTGGIVAAQNVVQPRGSLVELPLSLRLTPEVAQELLLPALNAAGLPTMSLLDESQQLALAVAWLRQQGHSGPTDPDSPAAKWQPYTNSMSSNIPCGWSKTAQELSVDFDDFLHQHGLDLAWWSYFVAQVHQQMADQANQLASRYGRALNVTSDDILWALGQITARKVVVDNQVLLEPWSDLLRHPPSSSSSSSSRNISSTASSNVCEVVWSYGLDRTGTSVVSQGSARRVATHSSSSNLLDDSSSNRSAARETQQHAATADVAHPQRQQQQEEEQLLLLAAGEELWASTSSSSGSSSSVNELFALFISEHGHLAPLAWYLQHGFVPQGLADVNMRTSDILESWRLTVEAESPRSSGSSDSTAVPLSSSSSSSRPPTVLWDYLTQQYQQDVLTVLAATPKKHQQQLLQWVLKPVHPGTAGSEQEAVLPVVSDVDDNTSVEQRSLLAAGPLPMIGVLDELLLAAIDAADEDASQKN